MSCYHQRLEKENHKLEEANGSLSGEICGFQVKYSICDIFWLANRGAQVGIDETTCEA